MDINVPDRRQLRISFLSLADAYINVKKLLCDKTSFEEQTRRFDRGFKGQRELLMRYYRYGREEMRHEVQASERKVKNLTGRFGDLIIDEDTVYEIDEECLRCRREQEHAVKK